MGSLSTPHFTHYSGQRQQQTSSGRRPKALLGRIRTAVSSPEVSIQGRLRDPQEPAGTPVLATAEGEIVFADFDETYGYMVVINHNDSITTIYGHNQELLVKTGDQVMAGSRIALSGNTGKSSAPHLHYEMRINNQPISPLEK